MSSNFDKAFNVAVANERASKELKVAEEREKQQNLNIARSLADPYLRGLGPKVVQKLRELNIPPKRLVTQNKSFLRAEQTICWWWLNNSPPYDTFSEINRVKILIHENGKFYLSDDWELTKGIRKRTGFVPIRPAVCRLEDTLSMNWTEFTTGNGVFDESQTFVDPKSQMVYTVTSTNSNFDKQTILDRLSKGQWSQIMELSGYIAHKIHRMR